MKQLKIIIPVLALSLASCSTPKEAYVDNDYIKVEEHCSGAQYMSTNKVMRASSSAVSMDKVMSEQIALDQARAELGKQMKVKVKSVTDNYVSQYVTNDKEDVGKRYQNLSRLVVDQTLTGAVPICKEVRQSKSTKKYTTWVALELKSDLVLEELKNEVMKDEKLRIDFEYEKFKDTFEEALAGE